MGIVSTSAASINHNATLRLQKLCTLVRQLETVTRWDLRYTCGCETNCSPKVKLGLRIPQVKLIIRQMQLHVAQ